MNYYQKYLKYKNKYLQLKRLSGGLSIPILEKVLNDSDFITSEFLVKIKKYINISENLEKIQKDIFIIILAEVIKNKYIKDKNLDESLNKTLTKYINKYNININIEEIIKLVKQDLIDFDLKDSIYISPPYDEEDTKDNSTYNINKKIKEQNLQYVKNYIKTILPESSLFNCLCKLFT
jgi:hypothetical protein